MNVNDAEWWVGAVVLALSGVLLFSPLVLGVEYTLVLLAVGTLGLALGSMLVGLSQRGRAA